MADIKILILNLFVTILVLIRYLLITYNSVVSIHLLVNIFYHLPHFFRQVIKNYYKYLVESSK